jgi:hypothetical protein
VFFWCPDKTSGDKISGGTKRQRKNVWRHNGQRHPWDKTSVGTKCPEGQNIQRDKTSGRPNVYGDKTSGDKRFFLLIFNTGILKNSKTILYSE